MPLLLSQCHLVAYTSTRFFRVWCSLFLFFDEPSSLFLLHKSPQSHKTLPLPPSQFHSWKQSWLFFFFGQKLLRSITLSLCSGYSFLLFLFFFFFFLSKKNSQKLSLLKRNFHLKLSRTLMQVQHLTECYGWSFNNGDLVLWVYNVFIFFNKNSSDLNHQNRSWFIEPEGWTVIRMGPFFFSWSGFWCLTDRNSKRFEVFLVGPYSLVRI